MSTWIICCTEMWKNNSAKTTNKKAYFCRREGWFKVQMSLQRCGVCLISASINTNIQTMKGNMEENSAEQPLLTLSKRSSSLFYPNLTLSLWTPDTNANVKRLMVSGCAVLSQWTCTLPVPLPHLMTCLLPAILKLWSLLSGRHLMRCVWGCDWRWLGEFQTLTFLCHPTSQRPHSHRQTPWEIHTTHQIWLSGFSKHPLKFYFPYFISISF